jgi:hypothetical protein
MARIYLLESISKKIKSKPLPLFSNFLATVWTNSCDSHCALSEEEEVGTMSISLYTGTVTTGIVTSPCPLLLRSTVAKGVVTSPCPLLLRSTVAMSVNDVIFCPSLVTSQAVDVRPPVATMLHGHYSDRPT